MLDGQGRLRITDFGLAGVAGEVKDIRSGTRGYMPPEQQSGQEVTARSDSGGSARGVHRQTPLGGFEPP